MASPSPLQWLETLSAGQSAVLMAVGAGMLGLLIAFCLGTRGSTSKNKDDPKSEEGETSKKERKNSESNGMKQKKQWKAKSAAKPRKTALPSHPLLAADFKGHTGAVLSLDFDSTGRYLVSCSDGISIHVPLTGPNHIAEFPSLLCNTF